MYQLDPQPTKKKSGCLGKIVKGILIIVGLLIALVVIVAVSSPNKIANTGVISEGKTATVVPIVANTPLPTNAPAPTATAHAPISYVYFNQLPSLDAGTNGKISIVKVGQFHSALQSTIIPVIIRNNTSQTVTRIQISATATDKAGKMLASGGSQMVIPNVVDPGQLSLGYVYFSSVELPPDASVEYEIASKDYGSFENIRDLPVKEHNMVDTRIVGKLVNPYDKIIKGPIGISAYCFDDKSNLIKQFSSFAQKDTAAPGDTIPFQVDVNQPCALYLIAANGFMQ